MTKDKLNISFVYDDSLDGSEGVAQYVKTLGKWLSDQGHRVSYLVGQTKIDNHHGGQVISLAKNIKVSFNANKLSVPVLASTKKTKLALKQFQPDILHVQMPHSPLMAQKVINHKSAKTAVLGTFHIVPASKMVTAGSKLLRLSYLGGLKKFDAVISVSAPAAQFAKQIFGLETKVVPNMVELIRFKTGDFKNEVGRIVFLGRLVERKGCEYLIRAFCEVQKNLPDARLVIAGDGPQKNNLKKLCYELGIENGVEFLGFIEEKDKPKLLASADIACFPSLYGESFGIVLVEAMAAGAGIVMGGDNLGYKSVLGDNLQVLFNPNDINEFAQKLLRNLTDKSLAQQIHLKQQKLVKKYDVEQVGPAIERIYYQLIAKK